MATKYKVRSGTISPKSGLISALTIACLAQQTLPSTAEQDTKDVSSKGKWSIGMICHQIAGASRTWNLPESYFARLIWTESRFNINAVSPAGAQGIAQFMPATARARGLENPFDPAEALPASASLLASLRDQFGNLGLAAAAYNAGPGRVDRWLKGHSQLPFETENFVAAITGRSAAFFKTKRTPTKIPALVPGKEFMEACTTLPVHRTRLQVVSTRMPWGVQVAGHFSKDQAMRIWLRIRPKLGLVTDAAEPDLLRERSLRGMRAKWVVRLGTNDRKSGIALCNHIRKAGGYCLVKRNR